MAKDKSNKTSAEASEDSSGVSAIEPQQATSKRRRGIFGFLRSDKSKSSKTRAGKLKVELSSDAEAQNNNRVTRSSSFSEPGSSKEQPTRKVKRHLSVSRSGKMKEVRKRTSINELVKSFEAQAQV